MSPATSTQHKLLGQILIRMGLLSEDQLHIALLEQNRKHQPLGRLLVQLGFATESVMREALSEFYGKQSVDLAHSIADPKRSRWSRANLPNATVCCR